MASIRALDGPIRLVLAAMLLVGASCAGVGGAGNEEIEGDFLVVALGDSYASGQGSPDRNAGWCPSREPAWLDKRCNRSRHAPTRRAVEMRVEAGDSVGFESVACSGASIEKGLLKGQMGPEPEPDDARLRPQVEALAQIAASLPAGEKLDAVTISIGGNDAWFQNIVMACMFSECAFSRPLVELALARLPALFDQLADGLDLVPGLTPGEILLVEYPDPTQDSDGTLCNGEPPFPEPFAGISGSDAAYAASYVIPTLNHHLCEAARRHGWLFVDGVRERYHRHGWCAQPGNWINTLLESEAQQGHYRGAMHPTPIGYDATAEEIAQVLGQLVAGTPPAPPTNCPAAPSPP